MGTSVLQDKAWEACFSLKLQTAFGNTSLRSSSASLHVNEEMKFELLNYEGGFSENVAF